MLQSNWMSSKIAKRLPKRNHFIPKIYQILGLEEYLITDTHSQGPVAQWTRACGYEPQCRGFESLLARNNTNTKGAQLLDEHFPLLDGIPKRIQFTSLLQFAKQLPHFASNPKKRSFLGLEAKSGTEINCVFIRASRAGVRTSFLGFDKFIPPHIF